MVAAFVGLPSFRIFPRICLCCLAINRSNLLPFRFDPPVALVCQGDRSGTKEERGRLRHRRQAMGFGPIQPCQAVISIFPAIAD